MLRWVSLTSAFAVSALSLLAGLTTTSQAAPIRYDFGGVIAKVGAHADVSVGDRFTGTFAYDPDEPSLALSIEGHEQYEFGVRNPSSSELTFQVGDRTIYQELGHLMVSVDDQDYDGQYGYEGPPNSRFSVLGLTSSSEPFAMVSLLNPARSVFNSFALPTTISLADFPQASLQYRTDPFMTPDDKGFVGTIDTLKAIPVPEPAALMTLGLAAIGLIGRPRRGRHETARV